MPSLYKMPVEQLGGIGKKKSELFAKLGIMNVGELIRFYPRTYEDWSMPYTIASAPENTPCCIRASVDKVYAPARLRGGMLLLKVDVTDGEDCLKLTFFNQQYTFDKLSSGGEFLFYGIVKANSFGYEMSSPQVMTTDRASIHPIYHQTAGLSTKQTEAAMRQAIRLLPEKVNDPIPQNILEKYNLCTLDFAIRNIHFPETMIHAAMARERLAFEELMTLQLGLAQMKTARREITTNRISNIFTDEFTALLPFELTGAQKKAVDDCIKDMSESCYPMNRLIQGDVGSGKTAVAAAVCYNVIRNGMQCAFMAPTEILSVQHFKSLSELLENTGIKIELLTGSLTASKKKAVYERLANGETDLVIGTHALISDSVSFKKLGLVITDEQHRFGVAQRAALISKGESPHIMVMSATPIPRTLALMIFGDLDISIIDELPPGRQKVDTFLIDGDKRDRAYGFLKKEIAAGHQCYIVCPLVEENVSGLASAEEYARHLQETVLSDCRIGVLHGKMKPKDKESVMDSFTNGETDILVSTTVIEVGVNVPSATVMMIENAERFGLSQLHQLRGRVGRGKNRSYCILVSDNQSETTLERLSVMCRTNNGFRIADEDLRLRGPGDFFGSRQHGLPELKIADLSGMELLEKTQSAARTILQDDPLLEKKEHRGLAFAVRSLFAAGGNTLN